MAVQWDLLRQQVDPGASFTRAFEAGRMRSALQGAARGNRNALGDLYGLNPAAAVQMEELNYQRAERERQAAFREAQGGYLRQRYASALPGGAGAVPGSPALGGQPNALLPPGEGGGAAPGAIALGGAPNALLPPSAPQGKPAAPSPLASMIDADPAAAQTFLRAQAERATEVLTRAAQMAVGVADQAALNAFRQRVQRLAATAGVEIDMSEIPETYSPENMEAFRLRALEVEEQLNQVRENRETDWRITDGQADNARDDRNVDSLIGHRVDDIQVRREGIAAGERNNVRSTDTSRDNNIRSTDTSRRGQEISAETARRGQEISAETARQSGAYGQGQRRNFTGQRYRQPDGRVIQFDTVSGTYVTVGVAGR